MSDSHQSIYPYSQLKATLNVIYCLDDFTTFQAHLINRMKRD